jgi:protein-S-isoprenylcysteine O-methyltransferase Ste14
VLQSAAMASEPNLTKLTDKTDSAEPSDSTEPTSEAPKPARKAVPNVPTEGGASQLEETRTRRAFWRWLAVLVVMAIFAVVFLKHPAYANDQFIPWRAVYPVILGLWVLLGIPYCIATLRKYEPEAGNSKRGSLKFYQNDGALMLIVLARIAWGKRNFAIWRQRRLRNTLLSMAVKGFFSPLMVGFFMGHVTNVMNHLARKKGMSTMPILRATDLTPSGLWKMVVTSVNHALQILPGSAELSSLFVGSTYSFINIKWAFDVAYDVIFIVDCGFALVGYLCELRWFGNKTRSVESTGLGWACAIFCYPPFNNNLGHYLPFHDAAMPHKIFASENALFAIHVFTVLLFSIYAGATVAFGAKFSNLTNRGIISRGPYAYIRHPAYTTKCMAWWLEHLARLTPQTALALIGLCCVYACRAWTEERHLSQDPEYLEYKKKVKWVAIPGVF